MHINKQLQAYQENTVQTAPKEQLTLMLYNGCIKFIKQSIDALEKNDYEMKNSYIQRSQDIIRELMLTLNQNMEISKQMLPLYDYIYYQLQQGNIHNEPKYLNEALQYTTEFRDAWKEAILKEQSNSPESNVEFK